MCKDKKNPRVYSKFYKKIEFDNTHKFYLIIAKKMSGCINYYWTLPLNQNLFHTYI